uniref:Ion transport domain-containing protein n=1 Tax=Pyrodinium bahamense TaxID=73915 RepID=A0A7S0B6R0_9DINO
MAGSFHELAVSLSQLHERLVQEHEREVAALLRSQPCAGCAPPEGGARRAAPAPTPRPVEPQDWPAGRPSLSSRRHSILVATTAAHPGWEFGSNLSVAPALAASTYMPNRNSVRSQCSPSRNSGHSAASPSRNSGRFSLRRNSNETAGEELVPWEEDYPSRHKKPMVLNVAASRWSAGTRHVHGKLSLPVPELPFESESPRVSTMCAEDLNLAMKAVYPIMAGQAKGTLRMVFMAWTDYLRRVKNDELHDDDDEIEAMREKAYVTWPVWDDTTEMHATSCYSLSGSSVSLHHIETMKHQTFLQRLVQPPSSRRRMCWDSVGFLLVLYDTFMIPMQAFDLPTTVWLTVMGYVTAVFWTLDLPSNFFIGFYTDGMVEMRIHRIAQHYISRWFLVDMPLVAIEWFWIFYQGDESRSSADLQFMRGFRSIRSLRLLRVLRLLRLAKLFPKMQEVFDSVQSDSLRLVLEITRALLIITTINHFVGCAWYAIGSTNEADPMNWLLAEGLGEGGEDWKLELDYLYSTSLHWAFCQFTPASMEVFPTNARERIFTNCVVIFGLVTLSTFVSGITSSMTALRSQNADRRRQDAAIRRYFDENKVSVNLGKCVMDWIQNNGKRRKTKVHESDIPVLKDVPERLLLLLHQEVYLPRLTTHPFFAEYQEIDFNGLRKICHRATSEQALLAEQELFSRATPATHMYFVVSGTLAYYLNALPPHSLVAGEWACEVVLWIPWVHRGSLCAETFTELVTLDAAAFQKITPKGSKALHRFLRAYAALYLRHECVFQAVGCLWLTDLCCTWADSSDLVQRAKDAAARIYRPSQSRSSLKKGHATLEALRVSGDA